MFRRRSPKREAVFNAWRMAQAERKDVRPTGIDFALWECELGTMGAFLPPTRRDEMTDDERH